MFALHCIRFVRANMVDAVTVNERIPCKANSMCVVVAVVVKIYLNVLSTNKPRTSLPDFFEAKSYYI
jgi:hypothetical protein